MTWYVIVLLCVSALMVVQFLMNILGGDLDSDVDLESSDLFSFKGLLHFVFGFTLTLTVMGYANIVSISVATAVGVVFFVGLLYLYRMVYKLKQEMHYQEILDKVPGEVYFWSNEQSTGQVIVTLEGRATTLSLTSDIPLKAGDKIIVSGTRKSVKFINYLN